jgi:DNA-binding transcriptional LysR family regulator
MACALFQSNISSSEFDWYLLSMNLDQLRYFVAVAEELHFRRAAERLHVSQPSLSLQVRMLEEQLGARLFSRTTRQVALTETGAVLLEKARRIIGLMREARSSVEEVSSGRSGKLRIGFTMSTTFQPFFYLSVLKYRRAYPDVAVTLSEGSSGRQIEELQTGTLDVGFVREPFNQTAGLEFTHLVEDALVLAIHHSHALASRRHSVAIAELRDEPMISYPAGGGIGIYHQIMQLCERAGFKPRIVQEAMEPSVIIGLVAAGLGAAIVPASLKGIHIAQVVYKPIRGSIARTALYLASREADASPRLKAFRGVVLGSLSAGGSRAA